MTRKLSSARTVLVAAWLAGGGAAHAAAGFSFHGVEFAPFEQRLPAAETFLRASVPPGTPLPEAIAAIRGAEASCRRRPAIDGAILCRYSQVASDSLADLPLGDVTWTVRLYPAPDGTVAKATVDRERAGL